MGLVFCNICGAYNQSTKSRCQSCDAPLFGEVIDDTDIGSAYNGTYIYDNIQNNNVEIYTTISGHHIKTHSFQSAKNELKRFSEQTTSELKLEEINEKKSVGEWFGDFFLGRGIGTDHVVKGDELKKLAEAIQKHLSSINSTEIKLITEFGQVYNALEALDADYIHDILKSIECAEKTAEEAKQAGLDAKKALKTTEKTVDDLCAAQKKIETAIAALKNTNIALSKFKSDLDKISHLKDVDKLWNDFQATKKNIPEIEKKLRSISEKLEKRCADVATLIQWKSTIEGINHIEDVDALWDDVIALRQDVQSAKQYIEQTGEDLKSQSQSLQELSYFINQIKGYEHLCDVDEMWSKCAANEDRLKNTEETLLSQQKQIDELKTAFPEMQSTNNNNKMLEKKLNIAYILSGTSLGIAVIELILLLLR